MRSTLFIALSIAVYGCNLSDTGHSSYLPPENFYAVLKLEHHAINLSMIAPYDTLTLKTIQEMGDGNVAPGEVEYSVNNPAITVTGGVLTAVSPVTKAVVRATLTHDGITRTDSAFVSVIAAAPNRLRNFGMKLNIGDSAKIGTGGGNKVIPMVREGESGANLSTLLVSFISSDPSVATIAQSGSNLRVTPIRPGRVMLYLSTFAFGKAWQDSLPFTTGWSVLFTVPSYERYVTGSLTKMLDLSLNDVTVGVGGCVVWRNMSENMDLDIEFEDTTNIVAPLGYNCAQNVLNPEVGGNIGPFHFISSDGTMEGILRSIFSPNGSRVFTKAGVYKYRSTLYETGGIIRVCDEKSDTTCAPLHAGGWY